MKAITIALIMAASVTTIACGDFTGSFHVHFSWENPPYLDNDLYLFARVEERVVANVPSNKILGTAGPVKYQPGVSLAIPPIPVGDNRVVIVEARESNDISAPLRDYGLSEFFSTEEGTDKQVNLLVPMQALPFGFLVIPQAGSSGSVKDPVVELAIVTETGVRAKVSSQQNFPTDKTMTVDLTVPSTLLDITGTWPVWAVPWSLDAYQSDRCLSQDSCERQVFVILIDSNNYESRIIESSVILDRRPPELSGNGSNIVPDQVFADTIVTITIQASELLEFAPELRISSEPANFIQVFPDPDEKDQRSANYIFESADNARTSWPKGEHVVEATLVDLAGHSAVVELGTLTVH